MSVVDRNNPNPTPIKAVWCVHCGGVRNCLPQYLLISSEEIDRLDTDLKLPWGWKCGICGRDANDMYEWKD